MLFFCSDELMFLVVLFIEFMLEKYEIENVIKYNIICRNVVNGFLRIWKDWFKDLVFYKVFYL